MIKKIPPDRWKKDLEKIFQVEFASDLPDPKYADIFGEYDEIGRIKTFIVRERIVMVGLVWSRTPAGAKNNGQSVRKLVKYLVDALPDGISVGAVASEERFEGLFRLFRMQKIPGTFFRRNL